MTDEERREKNAERQREWRAKNRERSRKQARKNAAAWRAENPERARELNAASAARARERDPEGEREKTRQRMAAWRAANPEKAKAADKRWRENNPNASRKKSARWREAHPETVAEMNKLYSETKRERRKNDPGWAQAQRDRTAEWTKSNPEKVMEKYRQHRSEQKNVLIAQLKGARYRAKKEGRVFDEALFDTIETVPANCEACGVAFVPTEPKPGGGRQINQRARSVDRVDNSKGYTLDNVGYICFHCNEIKRTATIDELKAIVTYMERHLARQQ